MKPKINAIEIGVWPRNHNKSFLHIEVNVYRSHRSDNYKKNSVERKKYVRLEDWDLRRYYHVTRSSLLRCQRAQVKLMER